MSYEHLAGRLIETQRSMLGDSAIKVARSTEGVTVTDDGSVKRIDGDRRAVVGELARKYTSLLGNPAEQRLLAAASEFEDELVLPAPLGGPETVAADDRGPTVDSASPGVPSDAVSDGGTVAVESAPETGPSASGAAGGEDGEDVSVAEPLTVKYTVASSITELDPGVDPENVYLMPAHDGGWRVPVSVEDAVVHAVVEATRLEEGAIDAVGEYVDSRRLLSTLSGEGGQTVSFGVEGVTVTFHRSGSLAVH